MKRFLLLLLLGIVFLAGKAAKQIKYPYYSHNKGDYSLSIDSVSLTDKATEFDVSFYNHNGMWVRLDPDSKLVGKATGKEYAILSVEGIKPGEKKYMPFSGYISSKIIFPPIAPADSIVDFIEPGGWEITGIKLYDDTKDKIKTNVSGTVESDLISWLYAMPVSSGPVNKKSYIIPVRNGKFNYDFYTEKPIECVIIPGNDFLEGIFGRTIKFKTEGRPLVFNFELDDTDL